MTLPKIEQSSNRDAERRLAAGTHTETDLLSIITRLGKDVLEAREHLDMVIKSGVMPSGQENGVPYDAHCVECGRRVTRRFGAWVCPVHGDACHVKFIARTL